MAFLVSPRTLPRYLRRYGYLFSWKRAWNLLKVLSSMLLSHLVRRPVVWGRPFLLMVEPTNLCNLKCPLCPSGNGRMSRPRGRMDPDQFAELVDQVADHVFLMMLWNQGEPYLNPDFNRMVHYAHQKKIFTFTSTNGHFIRTAGQARAVVESGLDEIIFALDGVDQETYEQYRVGGSLERVLEGIRLLVEAKERLASSTPLVNLQFIVMKQNQAELFEAERMARELKVDKFLVKTAQVYTPEEAEAFLPLEEEYRRYERDGEGKLKVKGQPARGCKVLWYSSMVNWDGRVAPCCFDKDLAFEMGRLEEKRLSEIWRGKAYTAFRRRILRDRRSVEICTNCAEGYRGMFSYIEELTR